MEPTRQAPARICRGPAKRSPTGRLLRTAFWTWAVGCAVMGATLSAAHLYAFPLPERGPSLENALERLRRPGESGDWIVVHVLYAQCRCSARVVDRIEARGAIPGVKEKMLVVGADDALLARVRSAGLEVHSVTADDLRDRWHVEAAPLLLVVSPEGKIRYAGGYTSRKQGLDIQDAEIVAATIADAPPAALPLFGCAVSRELQALLDPLGLKYGAK